MDESNQSVGPSYVDPGIGEYGGSWIGGYEMQGKPATPAPATKQPAQQVSKRQKVKNWQASFNNAIKGLEGGSVRPLAVDGIWGKNTQRAYDLAKANNGLKGLRQKLTEFKERGTPPLPPALEPINPPPLPPPTPQAPVAPQPQGRGVYSEIARRLSAKFPAVNLSDPRFKNLADAVKATTRDLYTVRDPRQLQQEIDKFVNSLSGQDIIQSMNIGR